MLKLEFEEFPILSTQRILLRKIDTKDVEQVFLLRSNTESMRYINRPLAQTIDDAYGYIKKIQDAFLEQIGITWAICDKTTNILMGTVGFWKFDFENYRTEIGYMLLPEYFKQGFMQEIFDEIIPFAFNVLNVHSIEANINPENFASRNILVKNGFIQEAYFRENYYFNGVFIDSAIFSLLQSTYLQKKQE